MNGQDGLHDGEHHGVDQRRERVRLETERLRVEGTLTLARDGFRSRVSDVLNAAERDFITLTDATVEPLAGGPVELHAYLSLGRRHIVFAVVLDEDRGERPPDARVDLV